MGFVLTRILPVSRCPGLEVCALDRVEIDDRITQHSANPTFRTKQPQFSFFASNICRVRWRTIAVTLRSSRTL